MDHARDKIIVIASTQALIMKLLILANIWKHRNRMAFVRDCARKRIVVANISSWMSGGGITKLICRMIRT